MRWSLKARRCGGSISRILKKLPDEDLCYFLDRWATSTCHSSQLCCGGLVTGKHSWEVWGFLPPPSPYLIGFVLGRACWEYWSHSYSRPGAFTEQWFYAKKDRPLRAGIGSSTTHQLLTSVAQKCTCPQPQFKSTGSVYSQSDNRSPENVKALK